MNRLTVLTLNRGSSSLKYGVHGMDASQTETLLAGSAPASGQEEPVAWIARQMEKSRLGAPDAIGHRIVHGGPKLQQPCLIDPGVLEQLEAASAFAPLHLPAALALIRATSQHFSGVPQMACFDTCFHARLPDVARVLPIARALCVDGLQRYGFHGLSCESILHQLGPDRPERLVIAHLGNGASVTAVKAGQSIDTSMGLTPTGGIIMGTRSGDLDPGVLLYLMRERGFDAAQCEDLVNRRSGLMGISGVSSDMRRLHEAASTNAAARLAIQMFCQSASKQIAAMIAVLNGIDMLVFTGGIGENDAEVRASICSRLAWIGIRLDPIRNSAAGSAPRKAMFGPIHASASRCKVQVLGSQEDAQLARHAWALLQAAAAG